jgi:hypothetical protein
MNGKIEEGLNEISTDIFNSVWEKYLQVKKQIYY